MPDRCEAVVTLAYEAQARIRDPVYGCVAHIFALQQQVTCLQAQLMQLKAQLAQSPVDSQNVGNQWAGNMAGMQSFLGYPSYMNSVSPQSSLESVDVCIDGMGMQEIESREELYTKKRPSQCELGELQELALRMMKN
ncbi:LOB domain-containing protein 16-like isoform X2 [Cornus florida]|nr:LOB domain-containing protein 16-like isoform X2 [Cornus florida]